MRLSANKLSWQCDPKTLIAAWPEYWPLALANFAHRDCVDAHADAHRQHSSSKVTVIARPQGRYCCMPDHKTTSCPLWSSYDDSQPPFQPNDLTGQPLDDLDLLLSWTAVPPINDPQTSPFLGGWIASIGYELCSQLEPTVTPRPISPDRAHWPLLEMLWCPTAFVHDADRDQWWAVGHWTESELETLMNAMALGENVGEQSIQCVSTNALISENAYVEKIDDVLDYIAAGDVFQVNLTQQFETTVTGSPRQLATRVACEPQAHFGAYLELGAQDGDTNARRWLASLSPELFLSFNPQTREVKTRPIKGTLAANQPAQTLLDSEKDKAELHMIIDLMRNDLGRVCTFGSITVSRDRWIETYPTVHHAIGEVTGVLKQGVQPGSLLKATFPPGSVTGAPKVRAMQIIRDLEPQPRGPYCGAIGLFGNDGSIELNVSIRTLWAYDESNTLGNPIQAKMYYGAGGGIVADSNPQAEYKESLQKMAVVEDLLTLPTPQTNPVTV
ncbi:MAG: anthranilate synthase component I family protein [Phycisphaerales bacterium]|nr:anthranilate synthase component I family protein [Phycisphaerales bacterium]